MKLRERRGVALVLVLWLIVVLGAVAVSVISVSRSETNIVASIRIRTVARYAAESGVAAVRAQYEQMLREADAPEGEIGIFPRLSERLARSGVQALGSARYQVVIADLNARVDLNRSDRAVLLGLFQQFVGDGEAEELVEALRDWKDEDDVASPLGGEAAEYLQDGSPFTPPNRPLLRLDELTRIRGFTDSIAAELAPYVTVYGDGYVNANSAPFPVLAAVPALGVTGAELLIQRRERGEPLRSLAQLAVRPSRITTLTTRVLVISRGWEDGSPLTHEIQAVFEVERVTSEGSPRLSLRYWTERDL
jgi:general secretion pathway protein K